jgi:hypothetical protein
VGKNLIPANLNVTLHKNFVFSLAYQHICGAAKWCKQAIRTADARKFFPRLADDSARAVFARGGSASPCGAFGRTLNFRNALSLYGIVAANKKGSKRCLLM